jgi:hypothetical protein
MPWLYAVGWLAKGKPTAGILLANSREDAFHVVEDLAVERKLTEDEFRMTVQQVPWDLLLDKIQKALTGDEEAAKALALLRGKLPAGYSEGEPPLPWQP